MNNSTHTESQNSAILAHLLTGEKITALDARVKFGCSALHSRISDLRNLMKIDVSDEWITVDTSNGKKRVKEYSIKK